MSRGYHISRDPECYGCGNASQWKEGVFCSDCRVPMRRFSTIENIREPDGVDALSARIEKLAPQGDTHNQPWYTFIKTKEV